MPPGTAEEGLSVGEVEEAEEKAAAIVSAFSFRFFAERLRETDKGMREREANRESKERK